jgi:hypothetical protein
MFFRRYPAIFYVGMGRIFTENGIKNVTTQACHSERSEESLKTNFNPDFGGQSRFFD